MRYPANIDRNTLHDAIAANAGGQLIEDAWPCDMISAHADLIRLHNARELRYGRNVEPQFLNAQPRPRQLSELLWEDFDRLAKGEPRLVDRAERYVFIEVARPVPGAYVRMIEINGRRVDLIYLRSPLLHWINSAFSKIYVLTAADPEAHCLPEHRDAMKGPMYSHTNLLAYFFNDLEVLFDLKRLALIFTPPHLASPYTYCQWIEAARRFILAHEIGHTFYERGTEPLDEFSQGLLTSTNLSPETVQALAEERWCDHFALNAIFKSCDQTAPSHPALVELANAIIAVFFLFNLLEIAEIARHRQGSESLSHPPARFRLYPLRDFIKEQPIYRNSQWLREILDIWWRKANKFRDFTGGADGPLVRTGWSMLEFREKLSPFGLAAYNALFQHTVWWVNQFHDGVSESFTADRASL